MISLTRVRCSVFPLSEFVVGVSNCPFLLFRVRVGTEYVNPCVSGLFGAWLWEPHSSRTDSAKSCSIDLKGFGMYSKVCCTRIKGLDLLGQYSR